MNSFKFSSINARRNKVSSLNDHVKTYSEAFPLNGDNDDGFFQPILAVVKVDTPTGEVILAIPRLYPSVTSCTSVVKKKIHIAGNSNDA